MGRARFAANVRSVYLLLGALLGVMGCSSEATTPAATGATSDGVLGSEGAVSGGQSGGEGEGSLDYSGPCACLFSGVLGEVLEPEGPCSRVRVLDTFDVYQNITVGEVLGGVLYPACSRSAPMAPGDRILFQYFLPSGVDDHCPERSACWQTCTDVTPECSKACATATSEVCADDVAMAHQTGTFSAIAVREDQVSFYFAGRERTASFDEVLGYECSNEHQRILDEYEREHPRPRVDDPPAPTAADLVPREMSLAPPPTPEPADCYSIDRLPEDE